MRATRFRDYPMRFRNAIPFCPVGWNECMLLWISLYSPVSEETAFLLFLFAFLHNCVYKFSRSIIFFKWSNDPLQIITLKAHYLRINNQGVWSEETLFNPSMQAAIFSKTILPQISFRENTVLTYSSNNKKMSALSNIWKEYEKQEKSGTVEKLQFLMCLL